MGRRLVAIDLGPRMHHDVRCAAFGQRRSTDQRAVRAIETQAHLGGDRDVFWHGTTHMLDDFVEQFRLLEQYRPALDLFTVLAGQPKFKSITCEPNSHANAAFSARHTGSEPSNCTRNGTPAAVWAPVSSSGASL